MLGRLDRPAFAGIVGSMPVLLLALLFAIIPYSPGQATSPLDQSSKKADPRVLICFSPKPGLLMSLDASGDLVSVHRPSLQSGSDLKIMSIKLSSHEIRGLELLARKLTEDFAQAASEYPGPVVSISQFPEAPPRNRLPSGMAVWRIWVDDQAWEFYAQSTAPASSPWNKNLDRLAQVFSSLEKKAVPFDPASAKFLTIYERPRQYFIPNLHASVLPSPTIKYVKRISPSSEKSQPVFPSASGFEYPGIWFFESELPSADRAVGYQTIDAPALTRKLIYEKKITSAPAAFNDCPVIKENLEASIWTVDLDEKR